jgi:hypothetical protein
VEEGNHIKNSRIDVSLEIPMKERDLTKGFGSLLEER